VPFVRFAGVAAAPLAHGRPDPGDLRENLGALDGALTPDQLARLDAVGRAATPA
jgi:hypothetical protein